MASSNFYTSSQWRKARELAIVNSGGMCARCGRIFKDTSKLIAHHKDYLKGNDYWNPSKALDQNNLEVICFDCHNKEHDRFRNHKEVIIVFGPPMSGKTSFVKREKSYDDLIVDMDSIWECVTGERYNHDGCMRFTVFDIKRALLDIVRTRAGQWRRAWVIGGYPDASERETLAKELRASCVLVEASKEECLARLSHVQDGRKDKVNEWTKYINDWFDRYAPVDSETGQVP